MTTTRVQHAPRPVFCVVEHVYRDRAVAEAVCDGRFTCAGVTLALGGEPDWLTSELPTDEEWRIEWSKFYFGLDLAAAFGETGDAAYLAAWERLVLSWIRVVPVGFDSSDVAARRVQNWIYAWKGFAESPEFRGLSTGVAERIVESLAAQTERIRADLTPERNHRTLELYALLVAALALPELDVDGLAAFARDELARNLLDDVRPDGVHREHSTHYHMIALRSYLGALENARRFGLRFPRGYEARLALACEFAMHVRRPDGGLPALSDSDTGDYADLLALAADLLDREDFRYAATSGRRGTPPAHASASFPAGGYYTQRSGWGERRDALRDERFLVFDCGALGDGGHGHYDALAVEVAAGGRPLVVDPGRYTYAEDGPNWRRWFKSTSAHNTVCVDGLDQTPYRRGKPNGPTASVRLVERVSTPDFDLLHGEVTSPAYDAVHVRRVFFVAREYWVVVDRIAGSSPRRFDLRFHLTPEAHDSVTLVRGADSTLATAPGLALVFGRAHGVRVEPGWVSPRYGEKHEAPVVAVGAEGAYSAHFVTVVFPLAAGGVAPKLRVRALEAELDGVSSIDVMGVGPAADAVDHIAWSAAPKRFELAGASVRATAAWARVSAAGDVLARAEGIGRKP